jgi:AmmeMemoRadiSam system protein B/AmmeMemoRadiSam system protein A
MNSIGCELRLLCAVLVLATLVGCAVPTTVAPSTEVRESVPSPPPGRIRRAVVAGSWYPGDLEDLAQLVDGMLAEVRPIDGAPVALIVPHAGYVFSGPVAATGFRQLEQGEYSVAVIIASDHQPPLSEPVAVWAEGGFETPLGVVPVDVELAQALLEASDLIDDDLAAHADEHAIEIELPFLQRVCPHCSIVPVLMGSDDEATVQALSEALLAALPEEGAVVVASSDLSHYPSQQDAVWVDGVTLAAVETGDPVALRETVDALMMSDVANLATCACGRGPMLVAMQVARGLGADTTTVLRYANSADSPRGDASQVVGYGAVMMWTYDTLTLSPEQQTEILELARTTIAEYLDSGAVSALELDDEVLNRLSGVFVTLKEQGELRGCIGHTQSDLPLYQAVQQTAVAAAVEDPRFPPLTADELAGVDIEVSILSPFRRVIDVEQIQVGTHGLMIYAMGHQGLLLPQVPVEQGWDRAEYLENLCYKAGLPAGCWEQGASLYLFTALVFGEGQ